MTDAMNLVNSKHIPKDFKREFDIHVYFDESTRKEAEELQAKLKTRFKADDLFVGYLLDKPVGPHPIAMFECNFQEPLFQEVVLWLMKERGNLNILVHPLTGDDYKDHTDCAIWLGKSIELNLEKL